MLVQFVLKYIEVVGGGHRYDVVLGVPGSVQDLLVKVQTVYADLVLFALPSRANLAGLEHRAGLATLPGRLQRHVLPVTPVEHSKEVVIGACHHDTVVSIPTALKLIKDAVVLIQ